MQAAQRRNRSMSESAGDIDSAAMANRIRRLSGCSSSLMMTNGPSTSAQPQKKTAQQSVHVNQYRNRAESFGSGRLSYHKRHLESSSAPQSQTQTRSRYNSGSVGKEVIKSSKNE